LSAFREYGPTSTSNIVYLQISFFGGTFCAEEFCRYINIYRYFDNTRPDVCASGPGPGLIETIMFRDDPSVDLAQVKSSLGRPPPPVLDTTITSMTMEPWEASTKTTFGFSSNDDEATFE